MRLKGTVARKKLHELASIHYAAGYHKLPRVWIIIADKQIASIFSKAGNSIEMIGEAYPADNEKTEEENAENSAKITYEPSMSPARRRAFRFAHEIAAWLDAAIQNDAFDRLVLVASHQTLGDIRGALSKRVSSRLVAEINKDLTKLEGSTLCEGLDKII